TLNSVAFDAVYVQFYNNPCGLNVYNSSNGFNFGLWDIWARSSPNPNVKVYVGAPASSTAAGSGYVDPSTLATILAKTRDRFPSFGGVMMWDASQAYANNRYDAAAKSALVAAGGTGFEFPACSAVAWSASGTYPGGSQVSYNGYIWQAKWYASGAPKADMNGDWQPISACAGNAPSSTTTSAGSAPTSGTGNCAGVAAWDSSIAYNGGQQVTYNGHLWTAKWWTQDETPSSTSDVWTDSGACKTSGKEQSASASAEATSKTDSATARPLKSSRFFRL
ncbi:glycoside hydrolase superfamily, partial [Epithele typhae]